MSEIPLFVDLRDWQVLIAGGGESALRAAVKFLNAGAYVNCWHPQFIPAFSELQQSHTQRLSLVRGELTQEMLCHMLKAKHGPRMVVLAAENSAADERNRLCCEEYGVLTCGASGRVTAGALIGRGDLRVAVSGGASPELEELFVKRLEREIPRDWEEGSLELAKIRASEETADMHPSLRDNYLRELSSALLECSGRFGAALSLLESRRKRKLL